MTGDPKQHAFPTVAALLLLTVAAAVCGAGSFAVVAWSVDVDTAWPSAAFATIVVWSGAVLAVIPVAVLGPRSVSHAIAAYMAGMIGRLMFCLAGAVVAVWLLELAAAPTLLSMSATYMVLLVVDVTLIGRYLSGRDSTVEPGAKPDSGKGADVETTA